MSDVTASYGTPYYFIAFFGIFSYIIDDHSCLKYCIYTKFSRFVCLINIHTYFDKWTCQIYVRFSGLFEFFENFNVRYVIIFQTFINFKEC